MWGATRGRCYLRDSGVHWHQNFICVVKTSIPVLSSINVYRRERRFEQAQINQTQTMSSGPFSPYGFRGNKTKGTLHVWQSLQLWARLSVILSYYKWALYADMQELIIYGQWQHGCTKIVKLCFHFLTCPTFWISCRNLYAIYCEWFYWQNFGCISEIVKFNAVSSVV
jgi:hypothetical protein